MSITIREVFNKYLGGYPCDNSGSIISFCVGGLLYTKVQHFYDTTTKSLQLPEDLNRMLLDCIMNIALSKSLLCLVYNIYQDCDENSTASLKMSELYNERCGYIVDKSIYYNSLMESVGLILKMTRMKLWNFNDKDFYKQVSDRANELSSIRHSIEVSYARDFGRLISLESIPSSEITLLGTLYS